MRSLHHLSLLGILLATLLAPAVHAAGEEFARAAAAEADGNHALALELYTPLGRQGSVRAQFALAELYAAGRGVDRNHDLAARWYLRGAMQGFAPAQYRLGQVHAQGLGVIRDFVRARTWFRLAADQRYAPAHLALGDLYAAGNGVERDYGEALRWYRSGAALGATEATEHLEALESRYAGLRRTVKVDLANLRTAPGTDAPVRGRLQRGTLLIELDRTDEWVEVYRLDDDPVRGWIFAELLEEPIPAVVIIKPMQPPPGKTATPVPLLPAAAETPLPPPQPVTDIAAAPIAPIAPAAPPSPAPVVDEPSAPVPDQAKARDEAAAVAATPPATLAVAPDMQPKQATETRVSAEMSAPPARFDEPAAAAKTEESATTEADRAIAKERKSLTARLGAITERTAALTRQVRALLDKRAAATGVQPASAQMMNLNALLARIEALEQAQRLQREQLKQAQEKIAGLGATLATLQQPLPKPTPGYDATTARMELILAERDALQARLKAAEEELRRLRAGQ